MVDSQEQAKQSQGSVSRFLDSRRNVILLISALVTITVGLLNVSFFGIKELYFFIGMVLTVLVVVGWRSFDDYLTQRILEENKKVQQRGTSISSLSSPNQGDEYERFYLSYAEVFGLAHEDLIIQGTVNTDGSVDVRRKVKLVAYWGGIGTVDQYLISDASQGKIQVGVIESPSSPFVNLSHRILKATSESLTLVIDILPHLAVGDSIELVVPEKTPPGSIATSYQESISKNKRYQCFYWDITRPTKHLEIKILIPEEIAPKSAEADVWFGPSGIRCDREFRRMNGALKKESAGNLYEELSLNVMYPVPGLRYVIKWIPVERTNQIEGR